jgi:hypothetical protein
MRNAGCVTAPFPFLVISLRSVTVLSTGCTGLLLARSLQFQIHSHFLQMNGIHDLVLIEGRAYLTIFVSPVVYPFCHVSLFDFFVKDI